MAGDTGRQRRAAHRPVAAAQGPHVAPVLLRDGPHRSGTRHRARTRTGTRPARLGTLVRRPAGGPGAWAELETRQRGAWLDLVRERGCRIKHQDRPARYTYELDGRHITDEPSLYLALGEAVNGPGGYFGGCLDALVDCLRGNFAYTAPATLLWRDAATAREHLSRLLTPEGEQYDLVALVLEVLTEGGMHVTCT